MRAALVASCLRGALPSYVKSEFTFKEISGCDVLPTSGGLAGGLLADSEEISQQRGTLSEAGGYFTLVRAMNFYERRDSENTMFLGWGGEEKVVVQEWEWGDER